MALEFFKDKNRMLTGMRTRDTRYELLLVSAELKLNDPNYHEYLWKAFWDDLFQGRIFVPACFCSDFQKCDNCTERDHHTHLDALGKVALADVLRDIEQ